MNLDSKFHKREITEPISEISQRMKNIETYIIRRYGMNPTFAREVSSILTTMSIDDRDIFSRKYDYVIESVIQNLTKQKVSSSNEAKHIREEEMKETLYSQSSSNIQPDTSHPQTSQLTDEQRELYLKKLEEQIKNAEELREKMFGRGR